MADGINAEIAAIRERFPTIGMIPEGIGPMYNAKFSFAPGVVIRRK